MFTKTEADDNILWCLLEEDAQEVAQKQIGRKLMEEELRLVQNGLDFGFEFWEEVMKTAIEEAVKDGKESMKKTLRECEGKGLNKNKEDYY